MSRGSVRVAVIGYGVIVALVAVVLWSRQLASLTSPCTVPRCVWPRLSADGFASVEVLGLTPTAWIVFAAGMSALCVIVPLVLGAITARATWTSGSAGTPGFLPALWFTFALGTLSAVPTGAAAAVLRTITLASWFSLFALFPTGRFVPRWAAIAPAVAVAWTLVLQLPPIAAREAANDPVWWLAEAAVYVCCVALIVAALIVQFHRGDAALRRRVGLVLLGLGLFTAFGVVNAVLELHLDPDTAGYGTLAGALGYEASGLLTILLISCVAVAMLRDGAYGIRVAVDRALVAATLVLVAVAVYGTIVAAASSALSGWLPPALAAIATACALAGIYGRVARAVGRLVHGDADDPVAVNAALDARIAATDTPGGLLPAIAAELAGRLRLPGVRIALDDDRIPAAASGSADPTASVPLVVGAARIGEVAVALRPRQRRLTARDRRALAAAAGPVSAAATAYRLSDELRRSRLAVLIGRDDERRALRRRLHDEVGPTLALAGHRIEAARTDPAQLDGAARTVVDAIAQVRAVSRELRPPALDDLGLRAAIGAFAEGLALSISLDAPERIRPGVVEVAAYRIVVEALLNTARHSAGAGAAVVVRRAEDGWLIRIDDDGTGLPEAVAPGVGMVSMRERAAELGGSVSFSSAPSGGARVTARLPAPDQDRDEEGP